jgi:hypothetical protein
MGLVVLLRWIDAEIKLTYGEGLIKETFPWFFEVRELISERPNLIPVGIGNNNTEIDMTTYLQDSNTMMMVSRIWRQMV